MRKEIDRNVNAGADPGPKGQKPYIRPELVKKQELVQVTEAAQDGSPV